jgi:hypothetical protein
MCSWIVYALGCGHKVTPLLVVEYKQLQTSSTALGHCFQSVVLEPSTSLTYLINKKIVMHAGNGGWGWSLAFLDDIDVSGPWTRFEWHCSGSISKGVKLDIKHSLYSWDGVVCIIPILLLRLCKVER